MRTLLTFILIVGLLPLLAQANSAEPNLVRLSQLKPQDAARLFAMQPGAKATLRLPIIGRKTVILTFIRKGDNGIDFWHGTLEGFPRSSVMFRREGPRLSGVIALANTQYQLNATTQAVQVSKGPLPPASGSSPLLNPGRSGSPLQLGKGQWPVEINEAILKHSRQGDEVHLNLPDRTQLALVFQRYQSDTNGVLTWTGYARNDGPGFDAIISSKAGFVEGSIRTRQAHYRLSTIQGQVVLTSHEQAGETPLQNTQDTRPVTAQSIPTTANTGTSQTLVQPVVIVGGENKGTGYPCLRGVCGSGVYSTWNAATITLMVAYDTLLGNGDANAAQTIISQRVAAANTAYANSGVQVRLKLVHAEPIAGYPNNENSTALNELPPTEQPPVTTNSLFSGLPNLRNLYSADLVFFMRPFTYRSNGQTVGTQSCGIAYLLGGGLEGISGISQAGDFAYGVVSDGSSNGHYCDELTLAHEAGHLMGSAHDAGHANSTGVFAYSYGYGVDNDFGTIMSYIQPAVGLFSSPSLLKCGQALAACGTSTANNVRSINETRFAVSSFK